MAFNDKPCATCEHFDNVLRGTKPTNWGWCAKKSVYPMQEGPGQIFPAGVTRGEEPAPKIVRKDEIVGSCTQFLAKRVKPSKAELVNKLLTDNKGKVVLK